MLTVILHIDRPGFAMSSTQRPVNTAFSNLNHCEYMECGPYDLFHLNINTTSFLRDLKQYVPGSLQIHGEATIGNC